MIKENGTGSTCEKAIIEWIKFFKFDVGLQLADKITALDDFQATEDTAGHKEAAMSIRSLVLLSAIFEHFKNNWKHIVKKVTIVV